MLAMDTAGVLVLFRISQPMSEFAVPAFLEMMVC
jgi:hypothetical protein